MKKLKLTREWSELLQSYRYYFYYEGSLVKSFDDHEKEIAIKTFEDFKIHPIEIIMEA